MEKNKFLKKLKKEEKLNLIEPSENICEAYLEKSANCLKSAKLLLENKLLENSISITYYSMYNTLLAYLFKVGIKSENHTGSILLLQFLFENKELFQIIHKAKKERIDTQYYVTAKDKLNKTIAQELIYDAENFILKIKVLINTSNNEHIENIREKFLELLD